MKPEHFHSQLNFNGAEAGWKIQARFSKGRCSENDQFQQSIIKFQRIHKIQRPCSLPWPCLIIKLHCTLLSKYNYYDYSGVKLVICACVYTCK